MDTRQVADDLVAMWKRGEHRESGEKYWAEDVISREAMAGPMREIRGKQAVQEKSDWWEKTHEVNDASVSEAYVNGDQFIVEFKMDITSKETGERMKMSEMALYRIADGKIAEETFFAGAPTGG
ncbi:MAG: nuclear transport factor 2 family protein [Caulobacteraceae bacterium]|nr:nuclear transport factor 2 family protein [Caulobacter sp.]